MAVKWKESMRPVNTVIAEFVTDALYQLHANMFTQRVWPDEVYAGYADINRVREINGQWYSTGQGEKSIEGRVVKADNGGNVTVAFSFLDYMRFVDMGVGQGTKLGKVDSSRKARYQSRYVAKWDRRQGRSQRPAIMMEMRHVQRRITNYIQDYLGYEGQAYMLQNIDGITLPM